MSKGKEGRERERDRRMPRRGHRVAIADRSIAVTSARNHSRARANPRKIRSPIVYIEIRSCRNAPQGTYRAPISRGDERGRREASGMPARYSKKKSTESRGAPSFALAKFSPSRRSARMKAEGSLRSRPSNSSWAETHSFHLNRPASRSSS